MDVRRLSSGHFRLDFVQIRSLPGAHSPNLQVTGHTRRKQQKTRTLYSLVYLRVSKSSRCEISHGHCARRKGVTLIWLVIQLLSRALHLLCYAKVQNYHVDMVTFFTVGESVFCFEKGLESEAVQPWNGTEKIANQRFLSIYPLSIDGKKQKG